MNKNRFILPALIFCATLIVCYWIVGLPYVAYSKFIGLEFLFTFIGVLIGFALSLFTHVVGLIDKLKSRYSGISDVDEKKKKLNRVNNIYCEMKDDISFMFVSLIIVVIITLSSGLVKSFAATLVLMQKAEPGLLITLARIKASIVFAVFLLCLLSIKDLISISFKLSQHVVLED